MEPNPSLAPSPSNANASESTAGFGGVGDDGNEIPTVPLIGKNGTPARTLAVALKIRSAGEYEETTNIRSYAVVICSFFKSLPTYCGEICSNIPFSIATWAKVS